MNRDDIIREVEVYTILFNPHIKSFKIIDNPPDKIDNIYNSFDRLMDYNIWI